MHDEIGDADIYEKVDEGIPGGMAVQSPTEEGQARWLFRGLGHHPVGADAGVPSPGESDNVLAVRLTLVRQALQSKSLRIRMYHTSGWPQWGQTNRSGQRIACRCLAQPSSVANAFWNPNRLRSLYRFIPCMSWIRQYKDVMAATKRHLEINHLSA